MYPSVALDGEVLHREADTLKQGDLVVALSTDAPGSHIREITDHTVPTPSCVVYGKVQVASFIVSPSCAICDSYARCHQSPQRRARQQQ